MKQRMIFGDSRAARAAWGCWLALFIVTAAIIVHDSTRSTVPAYREGAVYWMTGRTIFADPGVGGFVYLPQAAVLFIPFALLPVVAGEVVWRFVNIGVFAFGIFRYADLGRRGPAEDLFPLMTLVSLPMAWDCARNGQATLAMTGLMLLAVTEIAHERWWRAVLWLSLGVAVKPLAIVLALLVMAVHRPLGWRLPAGLAAMALFPFVTQHPSYVLGQYAAFWSSLTKAVHVGVVAHGWTTPFTALRVAGIDVPERAQTVVRVAAAVVTLAIFWLGRRRFDDARSARFAYCLAAVYLILFSPRTENNTYAMLGPVIGLLLARVVLVEKRTAEGVLLGLIVAVLVSSRKVEHVLTPQVTDSWLAPLMAVIVSVYLVTKFFANAAWRNDGECGRQALR